MATGPTSAERRRGGEESPPILLQIFERNSHFNAVPKFPFSTRAFINHFLASLHEGAASGPGGDAYDAAAPAAAPARKREQLFCGEVKRFCDGA